MASGKILNLFWLLKISIFLMFLILFSQKYAFAQKKADSLTLLLQNAQNVEERVEILLSLSAELKDKSPPEALQFASQAIEVAKNNNLKSFIISAENSLAEIFYSQTEYKKAMEMAMKAMEDAENQGNEPEFIRALFNIGTIYNDLGNYETSSGFLFKALKLSEQAKNAKYTAMALNSIGILYHNRQNYDKAREFYSRAHEIAKNAGDETGITKGLNNLAAIYGIKGESAKARSYLNEALSFNLQRNDLDMAGINYLNLGFYYQEMKQFDSATACYQKAHKIYNDLGKPSGIIRTQVFFTEYYLALNNVENALYYAKEAMHGASDLGLKKLTYETAGLLNQIYLKKEDSLTALKYQVHQLMMKDSLNIEEKQSEILRLELQYTFEKAEQQRQAEQQRKALVNIIIWISFVFIILFIIMLWLRMKLKAKAILLEKEKLAIDNELKSKELTSNAMNLMKKNETLTKIATRLKALQLEAREDETRTALSKIRIELNKLVNDGGWEEFEVRFTQVHSIFYKKLMNEFPDLTPLEQRLCAFLRLNMTTKEISDLTGQSITALEMSRTRLRKKLGLTNTNANLVTFLNQF